MKKSSLLTFLFAFLPGAGQMYLGMMKKGVSIMLIFSAVCAVSAFLNIGLLMILTPVIWFYSFFDTFHIRSMTYEERLCYEDKFLFHMDDALQRDWAAILKKRHTLVGLGLIIVGIYALFNNFLHRFVWMLDERLPYLADLLRSIPTLLVAVGIILLGVHLLRGGKKKQAPAPEDDFVEYGGNDHEPRS